MPRTLNEARVMPKKDISVEALRHKDKRRNIPTAELKPVMDEKDKTPIRLAYERRNRDLDPQLVWRGKDEQDWSDLIVQAPALHPGKGPPEGSGLRPAAAIEGAGEGNRTADAGP